MDDFRKRLMKMVQSEPHLVAYYRATSVGQTIKMIGSSLIYIQTIKKDGEPILPITTSFVSDEAKDYRIDIYTTDITTIENLMFYGCDALVDIRIPNTINSIKYQAFRNCTGLRTLSIPVGVTTLGQDIFNGCTNLMLENDSLYLPSYGSSEFPALGGDVFKHITSLGSATSIASVAFKEKNKLEDIILPSTMVTINYQAFRHCPNLKNVTILAENPPTLGNDVFSGTTILSHIYVPASSVDAYKAASGWSSFANIISAIQ